MLLALYLIFSLAPSGPPDYFLPTTLLNFQCTLCGLCNCSSPTPAFLVCSCLSLLLGCTLCLDWFPDLLPSHTLVFQNTPPPRSLPGLSPPDSHLIVLCRSPWALRYLTLQNYTKSQWRHFQVLSRPLQFSVDKNSVSFIPSGVSPPPVPSSI